MTDLSPNQFRELGRLKARNYTISDYNASGPRDFASWGGLAEHHQERAEVYAQHAPELADEHNRLGMQARGIKAKNVIIGRGPMQEEREGQAHLPGMDRFDVADLHPANSALPKDHPDYVPTQKEWESARPEAALRMKNRDAIGPVYDKWSGPDTHQLVMGVHDLGENNGQFDPHGFVHEPSDIDHWAEDTARRVGENFRAPEDNGDSHAKQFYRSVGGGHSDKADVRMHWASQPTVDVPSNAIIHTGQYHDLETEEGGPGPASGNVPEGRARINTIRTSMEKDGFNPGSAPWLMKHNDRLYALDGHHRIQAAREAGLPSFPAKIWDRDAEFSRNQANALHIGQQFQNVVANHAISPAEPSSAAQRGGFGF